MNVYSHGGNIGDLIYGLPTVRALGGGQLNLHHRTNVCRGDQGRQFTPQSVALIAPLLELQPYIASVSYSRQPVGINLDVFRDRFARAPQGTPLADLHLHPFGLSPAARDTAWLRVPDVQLVAPVVIHRCPRYHNEKFPWKRVLETYRGNVVFVGSRPEHEAFCRAFGDMPYHATPNLLDLARVIAGSQLFIGNQSAPLAIAEGLKHRTIHEVYERYPNCRYVRAGTIFGYDGNVQLPPLDGRAERAKRFNLLVSSTRNVGDNSSAPVNYFPLDAEQRDVRVVGGIAGTDVILGGGGMLLPGEIDTRIRQIAAVARSLIAWGIGTNTHGKAADKYPDWLSQCGLVGLRDWGTPYQWVPCVSCMSPLFDNPPAPQHDVVVYEHWQQGTGGIHRIVGTDGLPRLTNAVSSMAAAIEFLASGATILTNSFHGAYWGTLLGRRVIAVPFSSKFHAMRHPVSLAAPGMDWRRFLPVAVSHPEALEECRRANTAFSDDVRTFYGA